MILPFSRHRIIGITGWLVPHATPTQRKRSCKTWGTTSFPRLPHLMCQSSPDKHAKKEIPGQVKDI